MAGISFKLATVFQAAGAVALAAVPVGRPCPLAAVEHLSPTSGPPILRMEYSTQVALAIAAAE
jgi:hypothetical protein